MLTGGGLLFDFMENIVSLKPKALQGYVGRQLSHFFPDESSLDELSTGLLDQALERTLFCFSNIRSPIYCSGSVIKFNHLHGDQYATFLYFLSRIAFEENKEEIYVKAALLNKSLHGLDLFGHVAMPSHFLLVHPVGTIIGRAQIGDNLVVYQGVTIGGKHKVDGQIDYPIIGDNCIFYANSTILGNTILPNDTIIGANTFVANYHLKESGKMVFGKLPDYRVMEPSNVSSFFNEK